MDFATVLGVVSGFLEEKGFRYAVIGGVALISYGLPRTTLDLDFIVESSTQDDLIGFLESRGYKTLHRSSGYSNHVHPDLLLWGSLDFVYIRGETAQELFAACRNTTGPGGLRMLVPKPEHLAALKVTAMKNNPARTFQDMADVRFLLNLPGVDSIQIRDYFDRQGMRDRFDDLEKI
ncbi:MAG: hypothetical protein ABI163_17950 [Thermoanaerobaculia bacterium]